MEYLNLKTRPATDDHDFKTLFHNMNLLITSLAGEIKEKKLCSGMQKPCKKGFSE